MPKRPRPGEWAVIYAEVTPRLKAKLEAQAKRNHRSATAELTIILEGALPDEEPPAARPKKGKKP